MSAVITDTIMTHSLTFAQEVTATGRWGRLAQRGLEVHADPCAGDPVAITVFGRQGSSDRVRIEIPWEELDRFADLLRVLARRHDTVARRTETGDAADAA
ncbi:MAG: hypothetical protein RLZZ127_2091 [Planctomycetota bacterium]|jgi:hypothetical protein